MSNKVVDLTGLSRFLANCDKRYTRKGEASGLGGPDSSIVVNKCIPRKPRKGMIYYFQDGVIKVKHGTPPTSEFLRKQNAEIALYQAEYDNSNKTFIISGPVIGNPDKWQQENSLHGASVLVKITKDGPFSINNCQLTLCPKGILDTTSSRLKIINRTIVNVYEVPFVDNYDPRSRTFVFDKFGGSRSFISIEHIGGQQDEIVQTCTRLRSYATCSYFTAFILKRPAKSRRRGQQCAIRTYRHQITSNMPIECTGSVLVRTVVRGHKSRGYCVKLVCLKGPYHKITRHYLG